MPRTPKASPSSALKSGQTVPDLRAICASLDLDTDGRKADLIERIKDYENANAPTLVKRLGGPKTDPHEGMDANNDGKVTRSEAASAKKRATPRKTPSALKRLQSDDGFLEDFSGMDENDDGRVTRSEARKARASSPMSVPEIKSKLLELGLSTKGLKAELLTRLSDALDKLSGAAGSPAGKEEAKEEAAAESEMGEVVASDATKDATFFPVFVGFAAVLACIAWHLHNLSLAAAK